MQAFGRADFYARYNGDARHSSPIPSVPDESPKGKACDFYPRNSRDKDAMKVIDNTSDLHHSDPQRSMGEILLSMNPTAVSSGADSSAEKLINKPGNSNLNSNRSSFWGRGPVRIFFLKTRHF